MPDQTSGNSPNAAPRSSQALPHYTDDLNPDNVDALDFSFDDIAPWDEPMDRIPIDQPVHYMAHVGENPYAQKRVAPDPMKTKNKQHRKALLTVYITVIVLCFAIVAGIGVMMMPQLTGYFWTDFDNYAFINGELLRYDSATDLSYKRYRDYLQEPVIYPGVFVDGVHIGGLTPAEAREKLGDEDAAAASFSITVNIGDKAWTLNNQNVPAHRDINGALLKAYSYGRTNTTAILLTQRTPFLERADTVMALRENYVYIYSKQTYDYAAVQSIVDEINAFVARDPVDAQIVSFDFNTRSFTFSDGQPGVSIDAAALYSQITGLLEQGAVNHSITVSPNLTFPAVTKEDLQNTFKMIAAFTTKTTSDSDRNNNINLACQTINGTVLLPGQIFSFNGTVGERTYARGYREAGAIIGGVLVDDVGGGICQVSSTLFNAVARANLEITSRSPHAWPSTYVNKGEDATVNWPNLDFKFKNNTEAPVFVIAYYKNRQCTAEIWGVSLGNNVTIDLSSKVIKTIEPPLEVLYVSNPELPAGTSKETIKLRTGYVVETYKVWYQNGLEFKREFLHTSTYRAYQRTIEYN
jgi:vancomycin resistance protein YoaR